ncbi:MAG: TolC family protein [Bacteroidetes bacterium]|uniref:TolC family protein n=1 Tax=Candidatus Cryptobacteroides faecipullorum TaxID=2840764 RepID=A0A9D9I8N6_9BACT|nr:TolC family protein [Candidatus Cryptobacteroides faecipullorum]
MRLTHILVALLPGLILSAPVQAQVTIDRCMEMARENYPQIRQLNLIEEASHYEVASIAKSWLPHLSISGKAAYQSDVVEMPFDIPGFSFDLPHDQYSLIGEISQTIWDGGVSGRQKEVAISGAQVQKEQVEVSLYSINERVEKIFLGILLYDGQLQQNSILEESLRRNARHAQACIENGTAYRSDLEMIQVNILNCEQQREELLQNRQAYVTMLEKLTGTSLEGKEFIVPDEEDGRLSGEEISRPEIGLYDAQIRQQDAMIRQLNAKISPKFSLSLQGGIGRPGLNILENTFQPYWTAGVKMSWDIGALYTRKDEKRKLDAQMRKIESDRETFLFNTGLDAVQMRSEIDKAKALLEKDRKIIALRESIRASGEEQYRNGVITMNDLMSRIDDEYNAKVAESIHRIQLLMAVYDLKNCLGYGMPADKTEY